MSDHDLTDPSVYEHWITERVRFSDTDLVGHVNNVAIAAHVESGRVAFASGLMGAFAGTGALVTLRRLEIDYRAEAHYPAELRVGSRLLALGRTSFTVGTGVFDGRRCVATAQGVLVQVGPDGPMPIEGATRAELERAL
jgi:acyl-CoA thioester hydrolase